MQQLDLRYRKILELILLSLLGAAGATFGIHAGILPGLENSLWDARARFAASPEQHNPRIKIIALDQDSLSRGPSIDEKIEWPWQRRWFGLITNFLARGHAKVVGFDIVFSEGGSYGVEEDRAFAQAIKETSIPVISAVVGEDRTLTGAEATREAELGSGLSGTPSSPGWEKLLRDGRQAVTWSIRTPYPELFDVSRGFGAVNGEADADGQFRHFKLSYEKGGLFIPSMAAAVAAFALNGNAPTLAPEAITAQGLMAHFYGPTATYKTYSARNIIQSEVNILNHEAPWIDPKEFQDTIVLIGYTAKELSDVRSGPLATDMPGVEFHATLIDNLLSGRAVRVVPLPFTSAVAFAAILLAVAGALFFPSVVMGLLIAVLSAVLLTLAAFGAALHDWWLPLFWPLLGIGASTICALGVQYFQEGRSHRFIRNVFRHYVSPAVMEKMIHEPHALALGGERRELSIFFSDIAGFTTISEQLPAEKLALLLTKLLSGMTEVIQQHQGTVDKYVGDAIVAFWNAPLSQPEHARQAVQAALDCQLRLTQLNKEFKEEFGLHLKLRIGIHTGVVSVGNFGSHDRFNYTVVGDAANLASRLEGANKALGTDVMISASTFEALHGTIPARKLAVLRVVGRSEAVSVYEPGNSLDASGATSFEQARSLFDSGNWEEAARIFATLPNDAVAKAYLKRIQQEAQVLPRTAVWNLAEK